LTSLEVGIGSGVNHIGIVRSLFAEFVIDHVVDLVEPLAGIPTERVLLDELGRGCPTELARQNVLHVVEDIIGMLRTKCDEVEKLPP
jgi:hypothetical protein